MKEAYQSAGEYNPSKKARFFPFIFYMFFIHVTALFGLFLFPPTGGRLLVGALVTAFLILNITVFYHRYFSHRSFHTHKWVARVFATLGLLSWNMGPIFWASIHRFHHRYTETEQDPHNGLRGFWYQHVLWLAHLDPRWHPDNLIGRPERFRQFAPDVAADPYYMYLERYFAVPTFIYWVLLLAIGGSEWFFWAGIIPLMLSYHIIAFINSASHRYGYRTYNTKDESTNFWPIGVLCLGEGWQNNHHAFPAAAKHGFHRWWELDISYLFIVLMKKIGLFSDVKMLPRHHRSNSSAAEAGELRA